MFFQEQITYCVFFELYIKQSEVINITSSLTPPLPPLRLTYKSCSHFNYTLAKLGVGKCYRKNMSELVLQINLPVEQAQSLRKCYITVAVGTDFISQAKLDRNKAGLIDWILQPIHSLGVI